MSDIIERLGRPAATAKELKERQHMARLINKAAGVEFLESIPSMASHELLRLALGEPYRHLKEAATEELASRLNILDEIIAERRQQA